MTGRLALVLHAHLPFVRHPEHEDFLEEDWLFEAITETYIPLLIDDAAARADGVPFRLTLSLTPTLCAMLQRSAAARALSALLDRAIGLARQEIERNRDHEPLRELSQFYLDTFTECRRRFVEEWKCDLLGAFGRLQETGAIEIIASAATHGFLPLLQQSPEAVRAQILIGCDIIGKRFGCEPRGFWLPECAYTPALDEILQEANMRWFIVDAHGLDLRQTAPAPRELRAVLHTSRAGRLRARSRIEPASLERAGRLSGRSSVPRFLSRRRLRFAARIFAPIPAFSGRPQIYRIEISSHHRPRAGQGNLLPRLGRERGGGHANHFLDARRKQIADLGTFGFDPIVVIPFDAELFGHWWFEGPRFLDLFIRKATYDQRDFQLTTPSEYLSQHPTQQIVAPAASSWGENGYSRSLARSEQIPGFIRTCMRLLVE